MVGKPLILYNEKKISSLICCFVVGHDSSLFTNYDILGEREMS